MKPERILLVISILGTIILLLLSNFNKPIISGEVIKVEQTKNSIKIDLSNHAEEIIIVNKTKLSGELKIGQNVKIYGEKQTSQSKTTIFVDKIILVK